MTPLNLLLKKRLMLVLLRARVTRATLGTAAVLLATAPVAAQSASDKATARKLATDGIKLYQQGQYEEALDRLRRAQALYDAPVHLLYMARAQVQLGKLIEGAESYRRLVRTELDAKAPDVFKAAIADGEQELAEVEPRIPALTINVEPSSVAGLEIKLDGESISTAVLGVERPVNPGQRVVVVQAPGYLAAESTATLREGETQAVSLTLEVDPNAPKEPAAAPAAPAATTAAAAPDKSEDDWQNEEIPQGAVGFFLGLRVGGLFPTGSLEDDVSTADYMSTGGGGEIHGGVRFLRNFGAKLFYERYSLLTGQALDGAPFPELENQQFEVTSRANVSSFGVSVLAGTERGRIGGYGELGFAILHEYGWDRDVTDTNRADPPDFDPCVQSEAYRGGAFRVGGAFVFPVHRNMQLTAVAMATLGTFRTHTITTDCRLDGRAPPPDLDQDIQNTEMHQQFFIGVGGDFVFGSG